MCQQYTDKIFHSTMENTISDDKWLTPHCCNNIHISATGKQALVSSKMTDAYFPVFNSFYQLKL